MRCIRCWHQRHGNPDRGHGHLPDLLHDDDTRHRAGVGRCADLRQQDLRLGDGSADGLPERPNAHTDRAQTTLSAARCGRLGSFRVAAVRRASVRQPERHGRLVRLCPADVRDRLHDLLRAVPVDAGGDGWRLPRSNPTDVLSDAVQLRGPADWHRRRADHRVRLDGSVLPRDGAHASRTLRPRKPASANSDGLRCATGPSFCWSAARHCS